MVNIFIEKKVKTKIIYLNCILSIDQNMEEIKRMQIMEGENYFIQLEIMIIFIESTD